MLFYEIVGNEYFPGPPQVNILLLTLQVIDFFVFFTTHCVTIVFVIYSKAYYIFGCWNEFPLVTK